jgi:hypothetical protein
LASAATSAGAEEILFPKTGRPMNVPKISALTYASELNGR